MNVPKNEEIVRAIYSEFLTGNIEGVLSRHSPDVVWEFPGRAGNPAGG